MNFVSILLLAIGLAMDATAVAGARGLAVARVTPGNAFRIAFLFGAFQAGMPLLGWALGRQLGSVVAKWEHWIAFILLAGVGGKMLHEAWSAGPEKREENDASPFAWRPLLVLAIATSIDAFAVGITLPMLHAPFAVTLTTIGVVTAALSAAGVYAGRRFGAMLGRRLDAFGGLVLVGLAIKSLVS